MTNYGKMSYFNYLDQIGLPIQSEKEILVCLVKEKGKKVLNLYN